MENHDPFLHEAIALSKSAVENGDEPFGSLLVKDGDTTVIGGIYTRKTAENMSQVPILGDIPIIGWLFKSKNVADDRTELLIFISPTIVNRDSSIVAGN